MTPSSPSPGLATRQVHTGYVPGTPQNSVAVPIYQTTAYQFDSFHQARELFALRGSGNLYSRNGTPTQAVLEKRVNDLEGGVGALAVGSGQAAVATALLALLGNGDHVVASNKLYGGTSDLLGDTFADLGIECTLVDPLDLAAWEAAIRPETRVVFLESVGNPIATLPDLRAIADLAHAHGIPVVVDNTVATPVLFRPFEHGADFVVHSATKFMGGHGTSMAGVVVDGGTFDPSVEPHKWPVFTREYERYGGIVFADAFALPAPRTPRPDGKSPFLVLARSKVVHDLGPSLSPFNAFEILNGLDTLSLRMQRVTESALRVAAWLEDHPLVARVHHPGLESHPDHAVADRDFPQGIGAVFSVDLALPGFEEPVYDLDGDTAERLFDAIGTFVDSLQVFGLVANIGDARSLIVHPATMTHCRLTPAEREAGRISFTTLRLSIGLEDVPDLVADLDQAFTKVREALDASARAAA
ncbi:O-acetylhomoserine aminocarboxypropyltransferase/cysteine synthase family protein [Brevibacterium litoralis]|uniref:O-acetylhomoserine aminocarboxypropyltransferase/cysteine synthase family protein n=1 Tax=Brevibacterium litoralis TaxID=3138935 RepID=UPI0032EAEAD3